MTAVAQVRTGGLTDPDETLKGKSEKKIIALQDHLRERDRICSAQKPMLNHPDLFQMYLRLSLLESTKAPVEDCGDVDKYLACLNDNNDLNLKAYALSRESDIEWVENEYKIERKEAIKMILFFQELGAKK